MKKVIILLLAFVMALGCLAGCAPTKEGEGYTIDQEKYLLGLGAVPYGGGMDPSADTCATPENVATLTGALGAKTVRVWMHLTHILELDENGEPQLIEQRYQFYRNYIDLLKEQGVERILAMSHYYLYPKEISWYNGAIPDPDEETENYLLFMQTLQKCYAVLAEAFPEIRYWEPCNEPNIDNGHFVHKLGWQDGADSMTNAQYIFDLEDTAQIILDLGYYCNLGIKEADPDNVIVMPGLVCNQYQEELAADILVEMYKQIDSGEMPTGLDADTDSDNYFEIANWHPYSWSAGAQLSDKWKNTQKAMYQAMIDGGDEGKKVWFTEFGYPDNMFYEGYEIDDRQRAEAQEQICGAWVEFFDWAKENFPQLETVFIFRLFDHSRFSVEGSIEKYFGLFETQYYDTKGLVPKPSAYAIYRYFNGEDADVSALEQLMKNSETTEEIA